MSAFAHAGKVKTDPWEETSSYSIQVHNRLKRYMSSCNGKQGDCGRTNVSLFCKEKNDHQNNVSGHTSNKCTYLFS